MVEGMMLSMADEVVSASRFWGVTWNPRNVTIIASCALDTLICSVPTTEVWIFGTMNAVTMHVLSARESKWVVPTYQLSLRPILGYRGLRDLFGLRQAHRDAQSLMT